jgi:hypothetical protein
MVRKAHLFPLSLSDFDSVAGFDDPLAKSISLAL